MIDVTINTIKTKIDKLTCEFGGQAAAALTGTAYHACNPYRPNGWDAPAVQLDGYILSTGKAQWNFDEFVADCETDGIVIDDDGMYPWENEFEFVAEEKFDLEDEDDLKFVMEEVLVEM